MSTSSGRAGIPASVSASAISVRVLDVVLVRNVRATERWSSSFNVSAAPSIGSHDVTSTPSMSNSTPPTVCMPPKIVRRRAVSG